MSAVTVVKINKLEAFGKDDDGVVIPLVKFHRVPSLKVGDVVEGYFLNDDDDPDDFYFEVSHKA